VARTAEQVNACKDVRLTGGEPGLVGYWPLAEIDANGQTPDASPNGNHGTVHGATVTSDSDLTIKNVMGCGCQ
jgi:hypothetical protein